MEMTTSSSTRVKAARRRRGVKGFRGEGIKGAGIFDFGCWMLGWAESERCKGGKVRRWAEDFGFWILDVGLMEKVERFEERGSRRRIALREFKLNLKLK